MITKNRLRSIINSDDYLNDNDDFFFCFNIAYFFKFKKKKNLRNLLINNKIVKLKVKYLMNQRNNNIFAID